LLLLLLLLHSLLQAGQALQPHSGVISAALTAAIRNVSKAVLNRGCGLQTFVRLGGGGAAAAAAERTKLL
jgi:hypothetical protein